MTARPSSRVLRIGLDVFFFYVGLVTVLQGIRMSKVMRTWIVGDWLINYEGGFIRRGLAGQFFLLLGRLFHQSPVIFVVASYLILYLIFILAFRNLAQRSLENPWILALIFSPATLSYQVLHGTVGFRKEILFLATLALYVVVLRETKLSRTASSILLTIVVVICTLSHEGLAFYLPYFSAAVLLNGRSFVQGVRELALPTVAGATTLLLCAGHLGSPESVGLICSSLGDSFSLDGGGTGICVNGAIPYLAKTPAVAGADTLAMILGHRYLWTYPCYAVLALVPAIGESIVLVRAGARRELRIIWVTAAISFVGTLILFRYAMDWGRWIYIHVASISILLLWLDREYRERNIPEVKATVVRPWSRKLAVGMLLFAYATFWILPNDSEALRMGYVGRVFDTIHSRARSSPN